MPHFYLVRLILTNRRVCNCFLSKTRMISTQNADQTSVNFCEQYLEDLDFCLKLVFRFYFIIPSNLHRAAVVLD